MDKKFTRKLMRAAVAAVLAAPLAAPVLAQVDTVNRAAGQAPSQSGDVRFDMRASQLIGKEVVNLRGENLGEVQNLFVDGQAAKVHYVVLSFGGELVQEDKLFAFPMTAFDLTRDRGELVLNVPPERLENAQGFARDTWPNYQLGENVASPATRGMMRGTELLGREVVGRNGNDAGEVQDFVVDINSGDISYVVLAFDKAWSLQDSLVPLPLSAFTFPRERGEELVLNLDRDRVATVRGFESTLWPELNAPDFRQNTKAYFLALERPMPSEVPSSGAPR